MRMRDKTAGMASIHKFSRRLMPRRTETPRTTKVSTTPTTIQPAAREIYAPTIVSLIIGYGLKRRKSARFREVGLGFWW